jgi:hypothetical protein
MDKAVFFQVCVPLLGVNHTAMLAIRHDTHTMSQKLLLFDVWVVCVVIVLVHLTMSSTSM